MKPSKKSLSQTLKTPQSLIHVKHNMTLVQYKYWIVLLHDIKRQIQAGVEPDKKGYFYIDMDEVTAIMGVKATQKKAIIFEDLHRLKNTTVTYNVMEKDGKIAKVGHGFINEWSVSNSRIGYVLPRVFIDAMLELDTDAKSIFQLLNWEVFNSFSGKYEAIIYKLCKDYEGVKRTPYMTMQEYREYIGLSEDDYPDIRDFKKRCLNLPIKTINESIASDISVEVRYEIQGRKTLGLYFMIQTKQMTLPIEEEAPKTDAFKFAKITIPVIEQKKYLEAMSESEIIATIERANEYSDTLTQKQKKANMGAIYQKAFSERWGIQHLEQKKLETKQQDQKQEAERAKRNKQREEETKIEVERQEKERIFSVFEAQSEDVQNSILDEVKQKYSDNQSMQSFLEKDRAKGNYKAFFTKSFMKFKEAMRDKGLIEG